MPLNIIQRHYGKHGGAINDILLENERSFIILPCGNFYLLYSVKEYGTMRNFWFLYYPNTFSDKRETFLKSQKYLLMFPPSYNHFVEFQETSINPGSIISAIISIPFPPPHLFYTF